MHPYLHTYCIILVACSVVVRGSFFGHETSDRFIRSVRPWIACPTAGMQWRTFVSTSALPPSSRSRSLPFPADSFPASAAPAPSPFFVSLNGIDGGCDGAALAIPRNENHACRSTKYLNRRTLSMRQRSGRTSRGPAHLTGGFHTSWKR